MKVLQFTVPVVNEDSVIVQEDILPYFYNYLHRHKESQITLILKGSGTVIVGNYTQRFKAGEIYIMGANQAHMFKASQNGSENSDRKNIHAVHVYFDPTRLKPLLDLPEFSAINNFLRNSTGCLQVPKEHFSKVSSDILSIKATTKMDRLFKLIYLLEYFATHIGVWKSLSTGFSRPSVTALEGIRMKDVLQYTVEHFAEQISLSRIAAIANMTPHAFCKYFKLHTRKTYSSFLNEIRINEACKLLLGAQTESIASIAYVAGFNSTITFNRVFKKVTGIPPGEYIKAYKFKKNSTPIQLLELQDFLKQ